MGDLATFWSNLDIFMLLRYEFENIALYLKKDYKNERHLCLIAHIFTKFSQNVCLINMHILSSNMPDVAVSYGRSFDFIAFYV